MPTWLHKIHARAARPAQAGPACPPPEALARSSSATSERDSLLKLSASSRGTPGATPPAAPPSPGARADLRQLAHEPPPLDAAALQAQRRRAEQMRDQRAEREVRALLARLGREPRLQYSAAVMDRVEVASGGLHLVEFFRSYSGIWVDVRREGQIPLLGELAGLLAEDGGCTLSDATALALANVLSARIGSVCASAPTQSPKLEVGLQAYHEMLSLCASGIRLRGDAEQLPQRAFRAASLEALVTLMARLTADGRVDNLEACTRLHALWSQPS